MYLDAVNQTNETNIMETNGIGLAKAVEVFEKWADWYPSQISHHGEMCCEIAREWITATDFSELGGGSVYAGPRWLRQKFNWGASAFPIYWCEAVRKQNARLRRARGAGARSFYRPRREKLSRATGAKIFRGRDQSMVVQLAR